MDSTTANITLQPDLENTLLGNLDILFIILVVSGVIVCLAVCCLVGRRKKSNRQERHEALEDFVEAPPLENHQYNQGDTFAVVTGLDQSILRGGVHTPESPPPSYYVADRGISFQSYISQTSSQIEIPPSYDELSNRGRTSLSSTVIHEECEADKVAEASGVVVKTADKASNRKSEPPVAGKEKKKENKRRTKSDVVKGRKQKITAALTSRKAEATERGDQNERGCASLLRNAEEGREGEEGSGQVTMPVRFSKKNSKTSRFTPV